MVRSIFDQADLSLSGIQLLPAYRALLMTGPYLLELVMELQRVMRTLNHFGAKLLAAICCKKGRPLA